MIKLVFVIRRREDLTPEDFHRFIDFARSSLFMTEEHPILDG